MRTEPLVIMDHVVVAQPSAWHQVLGLTSGTQVWAGLFDTNNLATAWKWVARLCSDEEAIYDRYDDFTVLPAELEHSIPDCATGQERQYLERTSPATASRRYAAAHQRK